MTDANWDGNMRMPQLCLMPKEKVHHKWLLTWSVLNMDSCSRQMGWKQQEFYVRQARTMKVILQMMMIYYHQDKPYNNNYNKRRGR
jgi:hypothetical protein